MNFKGTLRTISPVIVTVGIALVGCSLIAYGYAENPWVFIFSGASAIIFGIFLFLISRAASINNLNAKDGCVIVTLSWIFACFFGALPFYFFGLLEPRFFISFTQALYETVSGFTTTGASIYADVEILPRSLLFWRSLTHWLGGMGIVVLAVAILPKLGSGGLQAFRMESPGPIKTDKLVPRINETGKILYTVYFGITVLQTLLLMLAGINLFDALTHTFATVGTGGFSTHNASVAGLKNVYAEYIITFFMWLSGANFGLIYLTIWKRDLKALFKDAEFKTYTAIVLIAIAIITLTLAFNDYNGWPLIDDFRYAAFQVATIITTTGFATFDYSQWPAAAIMVLVIMMTIGASTGSTGGGIKVLRHIINFKFMKHEILKIIKPNLVTIVKVGGRAIDQRIVNSVLALTLIYFSTFFAGGFILTFFDLDIITALTASLANLSNIGPGLGLVGPAGNYSTLPPLALWVLIFEMLVGRLEIYTVFTLFNISLWRRWGRG